MKQIVFIVALAIIIVSYQNCGKVGFSEMPSVFSLNVDDISWTDGQGPETAVTSDIKKIDWNNDGNLDVVTTYIQGTNKVTQICMNVIVNQMSQCYPLGVEPSVLDIENDNYSTVSLVIADMDGDGKLDIVEFNKGRNVDSEIIFNRGIQNGVPQYERVSFYHHTISSSLIGQVIDVDNDGDMDIVFVEMLSAHCIQMGYQQSKSETCLRYAFSANGSGSPVTSYLTVVKNNNASFSPESDRYSVDLPNVYDPTLKIAPAPAPNLYNKTLKMSKLDNSSLVLFNDRYEDHYIVSFDNGINVRTVQKDPSVYNPTNYWAAFVDDLDGDGHKDLVHLCALGESSYIHYGETGGTYQIKALEESCKISGANAFDINGDGYKDIIAVQEEGSSKNVVVYYGMPGRNFSEKHLIKSNIVPTYELGTPIEFLNMDRNTTLDFIVGTKTTDLIFFRSN